MTDVPLLLSYSEIDAKLIKDGMMKGETYDPRDVIQRRKEKPQEDFAAELPQSDEDFLRWLAKWLGVRTKFADLLAERIYKIANKIAKSRISPTP